MNTTLDRRVRELMANEGFLDGWNLDADVTRLLNEAVACGDLAYNAGDWRTPASRRKALEAWNRRQA